MTVGIVGCGFVRATAGKSAGVIREALDSLDNA
jgi:hypothetical protein